VKQILITQGFTNLEWYSTGTHNICQTIAISPIVQVYKSCIL